MTMLPKYLLEMPSAGVAGIKYIDKSVNWEDIQSASIAGPWLILRLKGSWLSFRVPFFPDQFHRFRSEILQFAPAGSVVRELMVDLKECPKTRLRLIHLIILLLVLIALVVLTKFLIEDKLREHMDEHFSPLYAKQVD